MRTKRIRSHSQANKSHANVKLERELVRSLKEIMPGEKIRRGYRYGKVPAADIVMPVFWTQVGVYSAGNRADRKHWREIQNACPPGMVPTFVVKLPREEPFVQLRLDDFIDLLSEWWEMRHV